MLVSKGETCPSRGDPRCQSAFQRQTASTSKANSGILAQCSPETMGAVCAVVYLLTLIVFIPFPFYQDIVAATSGGGNRDAIIERKPMADGRVLHRFPHSKVTKQ